MLKVQEIRELIKLVDQSSIDEFVYENEGSKIKMKKNGAAVVTTTYQPAVHQVPAHAPAAQGHAPVQATAAIIQETAPAVTKEETAPISAVENLHKITSPMVGTFYASPNPDADIYVKVGSKVSTDTVVCIVEAMKLFNEIEAEVNGEVVEVLVKNGQLVEYGQPLFLVKPE